MFANEEKLEANMTSKVTHKIPVMLTEDAP